VDGRDPIGTPLQCGELVPTNEEMKRLCPDVPEVDDLFRTPDEAISSTSGKMRIVKPNGKGMDFKFGGMVLDRVAHAEALVIAIVIPAPLDGSTIPAESPTRT